MAIYFVQAIQGGPIKIGYANAPERRLKELQKMSPVALNIIKVIEGDRLYEAALHRHFSTLRTHGEWFEPGPALLGFIESPYEIAVPERVAPPDAPKPIHLTLVIKNYLDNLALEERVKPETERRVIPTVTELAEAAGIGRIQMQRVINGNVNKFNLDTGKAIIKTLRRRGFPTQVDDILIYREL